MAPPSIESGYFSSDIEQFLFHLVQNHVRFLIVGGEAVIFHGHARLTGDIDLFYELDPENSQRLFEALHHFWGETIPGIELPRDFKSGEILQFGVPPNRIDLMNQIDGVGFSDAWQNRVQVQLTLPTGAVSLNYIGKEELAKNKLASGRPKDIQDLRYFQSSE